MLKQRTRRIAVTGIGIVSPLGLQRESSWRAALAAHAGVATITHFDASGWPVQIAAEVKGFDAAALIEPKEQRKMARFIQFALIATAEALAHARLGSGALGERVGVYIGNGVGGLEVVEREHRRLCEAGPRKIAPSFVPASIDNLAAGHISIMFGARGPNLTVSTACASSAHAIGEAALAILNDRADMMICGGAEASITPLGIGGFAACRALSARNEAPAAASRPWDEQRDGFVMGEGAAVLILEDIEHARARGVEPIAVLAGYGASADGYHVTAPPADGEGAYRAMRAALLDADLAPAQIGYVNAHAASTPLGDTAESLAIERLFGADAKQVAVSSTKSMTGHLLGGAGALEAAFSILALRDQCLPPTINLQQASAQCRLDYVPHQAREKRFDAAMSNSFGFGGTNASLIFERV